MEYELDMMIYEQIVQFTRSNPDPFEGFDEGQAAWAVEIIEQAKLFCSHHKNTDWGVVNWYSESDNWMAKYINDCST